MCIRDRVSTVRVERMKKVEKAGKLTEQMMRNILDDKDIAPKVPVVKSGNATISTPVTPLSLIHIYSAPEVSAADDHAYLDTKLHTLLRCV